MSHFLEHGAIGLLALLEFFQIRVLWRAYQESQDGRIADGQKLVAVTERAVATMEKFDRLLQRTERGSP